MIKKILNLYFFGGSIYLLQVASGTIVCHLKNIIDPHFVFMVIFIAIGFVFINAIFNRSNILIKIIGSIFIVLYPIFNFIFLIRFFPFCEMTNF